MPNKIKIAVSSCLLGEAVRYDGTDKRIEYITEQLTRNYTLISLCPEIAVGMGVPRPPIHLRDDGENIEVVEVGNPIINMTKPLAEYGRKVVEMHADICGYILKKNSPSCGTQNVKVLNAQGAYERRGIGIYASEIITSLPNLPVIDEESFSDESSRSEFLTKVKKYYKDR